MKNNSVNENGEDSYLVNKSSSKMYKNKSKTIIIMSIIIIVGLLLFTTSTVSVLAYDKVYNGVYIENEDFSNLEKVQIKEKLNEILEINKQNKITLKTENDSITFKLDEIGLNYNVDEIVNNIYNKGRNGNFVDRIKDLIDLQFDSKKVYIEYTYNEVLLDKIVNNFYEMTYKEVKDFSYKINEKTEKLDVNSGHAKESVDKNIVKDEIKKVVINGDNEVINLEKNIEKQKVINIEKLYNDILLEVKESKVNLLSKKKYEITESATGVSVDKVVLKSEIEKINQVDNMDISIPINLTKPKTTKKSLEKVIFKDVLSTYQTTFGTSNYNRSTNIRIASAAINGVIILPGEVFSYNEVVGRRTSAKGYLEAGVYINGKVSKGIGGGICQVSTTLHNAVMRQADLSIVSRGNHMFPVPYVPNGYDAAVSYGSKDYKFKNKSDYPIMVNISANGSLLKVVIKGTKTNNKKVYLSTTGSGLNVNTYRTIKDGGKVISSKLLYSSSYKEHP